MYPRATAGEIGKRVLHDDDRNGLQALYGALPHTEPVDQALQMGCASISSSSAWWLCGSAVLLLRLSKSFRLRYRKAAVRRSTRGSRMAFALLAAGAAMPAKAQSLQVVGTARVMSRTPFRDGQRPGLIFTSLALRFEDCLSSDGCALSSIDVPGGRVGQLEQYVEHHPVPLVGELVGLARKGGRWVVYRLVDSAEAARFAQIAPGWRLTHEAGAAPRTAMQPAAVAK
jgi:hypothetical protein